MPDSRVSRLLENNRTWASEVEERRPGFFHDLAAQQRPDVLWIGCADSRVPANQILGLDPGEVFVHRNVANLVNPSDINVLTVIAYAVDALGVSDIIVCGHYGCGGVAAVHSGQRLGMLADWLWQIRATSRVHEAALQALAPEAREKRLGELSVIEQVQHVGNTSIVQKAWDAGKTLSVHGWIYGLEDGLLHDLDVSAADPDQLAATYERATGLHV
jgi:carbonic anhydrase